MSEEQPEDEVAEDYKASLEYLTTNDRYAINNFTVIARENTEHAAAITNVLLAHIKTAPPNHKLPALYVLDSIAKNIGTPYTLFLGHHLYNCFMGAYSLVDNQVRKKLDEMLKTWKNSVPGSIDARPVFPLEITKRIENALIQVKTRTLQQQQDQQRAQQELLRRRPPGMPGAPTWNQAPTPPPVTNRYPMPQYDNYGAAPQQNGFIPTNLSFPAQAFPHAVPSAPPYSDLPEGTYQYPPEALTIDSLHQDIENLIAMARAEFARNPYETSTQVRLKALLDLQLILKSQRLPPEQIQAVREQVSQLRLTSNTSAPPPHSSPLNPAPTNPAPVNTAPLLPATQPQPSTPYPPAASNPSNVNSTSLAGLLASAGRGLPTQPVHTSLSQTVSTPPPGTPAVLAAAQIQPPATGESALIASLRAAGILPAAKTPPVNLTPSLPPVVPRVSAMGPISGLTSLSQRPSPNEPRNHVVLTSSSLKEPRPHLIARLFEARPNQCLTCGRRFPATSEGKTRKARHLDWHFRTNSRMADALKRGQSRSWYVDEMEWINSREDAEGQENDRSDMLLSTKALAAASSSAAQNDPKLKFLPVPSDKTLAEQPCPICQEKFDMVWKEEIQDFVWVDAIKIGPKVYHASCYSDLKRDGGSTPSRISTPDSVLGKRKAEASTTDPLPSKLFRDSTE